MFRTEGERILVVVVENAVLTKDQVLEKENAREVYAALMKDGWRKVPPDEIEKCNMSARRLRAAMRR